MASISPFYSLNQLVFHTNDQCPQARSIDPINQVEGTGGKVDCLCCRHLNKMEHKKGLNARFLKRLRKIN